MSRLFIFLNLFLVLIVTTAALGEHSPKPKPKANQKPHTFVLPVSKDAKNGLYYTKVTVGQPPLGVDVAVDIHGGSLWFQCEKIGYNSTTYTPISCGSPKCSQDNDRCLDSCSGPYGPWCRKNTCTPYLYYHAFVPVVEDNIIVSYTSPLASAPQKLAARLPLACTPTNYDMSWLRTGSHGVLGLGNSTTSFVNGLVSSYKIPFKVALCLPSKPGVNYSGLVYIGGGPYVLPPNGKDVSGLLVSTPLIRDIRPNMDDSYYIDVKSIEVNGKTLSFDRKLLTFNRSESEGGTRINTLATYTYVDSSIYKPLLTAFAGNAEKEKAVAPFSDCFSSASFGGRKTPVISLVLGGGVKWNIFGRNSLVRINKSVVCLGFINAGYRVRVPIEIGGYLMEDNLVEFDLEASKFSFTSSLLRHNTSCSRM